MLELLRPADTVSGIVIRPACVYGRSGSYFADYHFIPALKAVREGKDTFESISSVNGKILTVHADDAADLFVRVAERAPACRGQAFLAANSSTDNLRDILSGVVRVAGLKGYKVRDTEDGEDPPPQLTSEYEVAWVTPLLAHPSLGHALTGWTPRRLGVSDGIDIYWVRGSQYAHAELLPALGQGRVLNTVHARRAIIPLLCLQPRPSLPVLVVPRRVVHWREGIRPAGVCPHYTPRILLMRHRQRGSSPTLVRLQVGQRGVLVVIVRG